MKESAIACRRVATGLGPNNRGLYVTMFVLVIVQWLYQGTALRAWYLSDIGFIS